MAFANPYLAVRNLSMGLAGTDFQHHVTFARAAENYRRSFVKKMNKDMEVNHKPGIAYGDYNLGKEMLASIDPFSYEPPRAVSILGDQWRSLMALAFWFVALMVASLLYAPKIPKI